MKRIFIDTNIVLDFLLEREPFVEDAVRLFSKLDAGEIAGFVAILQLLIFIILFVKPQV